MNFATWPVEVVMSSGGSGCTTVSMQGQKKDPPNIPLPFPPLLLLTPPHLVGAGGGTPCCLGCAHTQQEATSVCVAAQVLLSEVTL